MAGRDFLSRSHTPRIKHDNFNLLFIFGRPASWRTTTPVQGGTPCRYNRLSVLFITVGS